ncbi:hypothetical protein [Lonepinella sp. MS14436]|uniref:hypothetical protein n=1 Tax=Lonepinella sp. MS14436 TaxID=3003619 RepID=UPI0036DA109B
MNSINDSIINEIFEGRLDIAIIISKREYYFVFDDKEDFVIDIRPFYLSYLKRKIITEEQYDYALKNYRGGACLLNNDSITNYFNSLNISPKDYYWMKDFFTYDFPISKDECSSIFIEKIRMRLPRFYLNLDEKNFFHSYQDRFFENDLPSNWNGDYSDDFLALIPDMYKYWVVSGVDFSKL